VTDPRFHPDLWRGSLDMMVLSTLSDGAKYGYLIQTRLRESSGGRLQLQAGTLYPLLHRLEAERLIRARWDDSTGRKRKWYELTTAGRRRLSRDVAQWQAFVSCIRDVLGGLLEPLPAPASASG
jgi:DNA-binding PadR family transcriptional regulator